MRVFFAVDTSNYTTSAALVSEQDGVLSLVSDVRRLLPVREGEKGVRQSDAVFHHTRALPGIVGEAFGAVSGRGGFSVAAVGCSDRPCSLEGSYMPCFLAGLSAASAAAAAAGAPLYRFTHQQGHVAAVLFGADRLDLLDREFLAFHVSGGTTQLVICRPAETGVFTAELVADTLDLKAGQLIDRVGVMLGLSFPAGAALERLALSSSRRFERIRPFFDGKSASVSGAQNVCERMLRGGEPAADVARYAIEYVACAIGLTVDAALEKYGDMPVVFVGGVTSDSIVADRLKKYDGVFCPRFALDNAAGVAVLTALGYGRSLSL